MSFNVRKLARNEQMDRRFIKPLGMKVCINSHGHMTKMATMAINNDNLKKNLLQNQEAYDFETWHEASWNGGLQNLYKS